MLEPGLVRWFTKAILSHGNRILAVRVSHLNTIVSHSIVVGHVSFFQLDPRYVFSGSPTVVQVESSTSPMILIRMIMTPFGLLKSIPYAFSLWQSNNLLEIKHRIIRLFPDPCPVPCIGNLTECLYDASVTLFDIFNLNFASILMFSHVRR